MFRTTHRKYLSMCSCNKWHDRRDGSNWHVRQHSANGTRPRDNSRVNDFGETSTTSPYARMHFFRRDAYSTWSNSPLRRRFVHDEYNVMCYILPTYPVLIARRGLHAKRKIKKISERRKSWDYFVSNFVSKREKGLSGLSGLQGG